MPTKGKCGTITLSAASASAGALGGPGSFDVTLAGVIRPWRPISTVAWITIDAPTAAQEASGSVNYTVAPNGAGQPARSGTIFVTGDTFTVNQAAGVIG